MATFRSRFAAWLDPQMAVDARRLERMRVEMHDASQWLRPEFIDASDTLLWALDNDWNWARPLGASSTGDFPPRIDAFRKFLRRRRLP